MGAYSSSGNREKTKSCNHITEVSNEPLSKEIEAFGKLNDMEPFQN